MSRFSRELIRRFGTPQAVCRRLGMDASLLDDDLDNPGSAMSAEEAKERLIDLIENLDDDQVMQFGDALRKMAGDKRGIRKAAADAREMARYERATADSLRAKAGRRQGRDSLEDLAPRGGYKREAEDKRRMTGDSLAYDERTGLPTFEHMFDASHIKLGGGF